MTMKNTVTALLGATALVAVGSIANAQSVDIDIGAGTITIAGANNGEVIDSTSDNDGAITGSVNGQDTTIQPGGDVTDTSVQLNNVSNSATALGTDDGNTINFADGLASADGDVLIGNLADNNGAIGATANGTVTDITIGANNLIGGSEAEVNNVTVSAVAGGTQAANAITGDFADVNTSGVANAVDLNLAAGTIINNNSFAISNAQNNDTGGAVSASADVNSVRITVTNVAATTDGVNIQNARITSQGNGNIGTNDITGSSTADNVGFAIASIQDNNATVGATSTGNTVEVAVAGTLDAPIDITSVTVGATAAANNIANTLSIDNSGDNNDLEINSGQINVAGADVGATIEDTTVGASITGVVTGTDVSVEQIEVRALASGNTSTNDLALNGTGGTNQGLIESEQVQQANISASVGGTSVTSIQTVDAVNGSTLTIDVATVSATAFGNRSVNRIDVGN